MTVPATKIMVLGPTGQVGREVIRVAPLWGHKIIPIGRDKLDLRSSDGALRIMERTQPDIVINAAAYTAVDAAEADPETAYAVNRDAPGALASACAAQNVPLLHLSTDYVFDGRAHNPYRETDAVAPLGVYGQSKYEGEILVRERWAKHVIVRTAWVYAAHGRNFVRTMLRLGRERPTLRVVDDQRGAPTSANAIADTLHRIVGQITGSSSQNWGLYHFTAAGETTWFGLARAIFEGVRPWYGPCPELEPIATIDYPTPARRPAYSVLDCDSIATSFGIDRQPWQKLLSDVLHELQSAE